MQKTVLIADDDRLTRDVLEFYITNQGHRVLICEDGREALNQLQKEMVNLILMDVLMPKMNGLEAYRRITAIEHARNVPVILMTGVYQREEIMRQLGLKSLGDRIIFKPITIDLLQSVLNRYLGKVDSKKIVFPSFIQSKPGFNKRINISKMKTVEESTDEVLIYLSKEGFINRVKVLQLLNFAYQNKGKWLIQVNANEFNARLLTLDEKLIGIWSDHTEDLEEDSLSDKFKKLSRRMFANETSIHPWLKTTKNTPFYKFLYRLITLDQGRYLLKHIQNDDDLMCEMEMITPKAIKPLIDEALAGPYPYEKLRSIFLMSASLFKISAGFSAVTQKLHVSKLQTEVLSAIKGEVLLKDILAQVKGSPDEINSGIYALCLLGVLEHRKQATVKVEQSPQERTIQSQIEMESRSARSAQETIELKFQQAVVGHYYDVIDVPRMASQQSIIEAINKAKVKVQKLRKQTDLSEVSLRKLNSIAFSLQECNVILNKSKLRKRYDEVINERDAGKKKKLSEQQLDRGLLCLGEGNIIRAIAELKIGLILDIRNQEAHLQLLQNMQTYPENLESLLFLSERAVKLFPDNVDFSLLLGRCYLDLEDGEKAIAEFRKVLEADPENVEAVQYLLRFPDKQKNLGFDID